MAGVVLLATPTATWRLCGQLLLLLGYLVESLTMSILTGVEIEFQEVHYSIGCFQGISAKTASRSGLATSSETTVELWTTNGVVTIVAIRAHS